MGTFRSVASCGVDPIREAGRLSSIARLWVETGLWRVQRGLSVRLEWTHPQGWSDPT